MKHLPLKVLLFLLALVTNPNNSFSAAAPSKLVIGYASTTPRLMPLWVARDQGFFAKYGIESEPVLLRSGATLVTGLASGDIQIGRTAGAAVLPAVAAGHDIKMLATFSKLKSKTWSTIASCANSMKAALSSEPSRHKARVLNKPLPLILMRSLHLKSRTRSTTEDD
jgi:ABC-type taurine transport system substrate-binding protein